MKTLKNNISKHDCASKLFGSWKLGSSWQKRNPGQPSSAVQQRKQGTWGLQASQTCHPQSSGVPPSLKHVVGHNLSTTSSDYQAQAFAQSHQISRCKPQRFDVPLLASRWSRGLCLSGCSAWCGEQSLAHCQLWSQ